MERDTSYTSGCHGQGSTKSQTFLQWQTVPPACPMRSTQTLSSFTTGVLPGTGRHALCHPLRSWDQAFLPHAQGSSTQLSALTIESGLGCDAPTHAEAIFSVADVEGRHGWMVGHLWPERRLWRHPPGTSSPSHPSLTQEQTFRVSSGNSRGAGPESQAWEDLNL